MHGNKTVFVIFNIKYADNKMKKFSIAILSGMLLLAFACSDTVYPSVTDSGEMTYHYGAVVWHDLASPEPEKSKKFYSEVFGWNFEKIGSSKQPYWVIKDGGKNIGGIIAKPNPEPNSGEWISSISVSSVDEAVSSVVGSGGKQLGKTLTLEGRGDVALMEDDQGAIFGLIHSSTGDPKQTDVEENRWLWHELWSNDPSVAESFYSGALGYDFKSEEVMGMDYWTMVLDGNVRNGMIRNPIENIRSVWVPYIKVKDADMASKKAEAAGARILMAPNQEVRKGSVSIILDPTGAPLALQEWPI